MCEIEVFIASPDSSYRFSTRNYVDSIHVNVCADNKTNLTTVYNEFLTKVRKEEQKPEFVIFMHHDAELDAKQLIYDLRRCKDRYDVIGLCGTEVLNISQSPLNWYTGSRPTPDRRWGCVTHGELGNSKAFFSQDRADVRDHEVACIDGVCIVFGPNAIASELMFDEQFKFDQYDTDLSLQVVMKYKMKLGVVVEESLMHYSVGKSIMTKDFLEHEKDLRKKWDIQLN